MSRLLEIATCAGASAFVVQRFSGDEALGRLPVYQLALLSERPDLSPMQMLGTNATVGLELPDGAPRRCFNGYFTQFVLAGEVRTPAFPSGVGALYRATLQPALWFRTLSSDSRIHRGVHLGELLLRHLGTDASMRIESRLGDTEWREMIVQYRETDFDFFSRLAEHAGISYHFEHENGAHTLVLTDGAAAHRPAPDLPELVFTGPRGADSPLGAFELATELQPGAVAVADHNHRAPGVRLAGVARAGAADDSADPLLGPCANGGFERFEHPAGATTRAGIERLARLRAEAWACRRARAHGSGTERRLRVGHTTRLRGHPLAALDRSYLIVAHRFHATNNLAHAGPGVAEASAAAFRAEFEAIPASVPFRPERRTPRPVLAGLHEARVVADARDDVGAAPELVHGEADGAGLGRVRLAFPWDRHGGYTAWVRVAQPGAGAGWGLQCLPRTGDAVLVQFLDGDPDRPIVTGRVHDAAHPPPYALPAQAPVSGLKSQSRDAQGHPVAGAFNEWRFDDRAGAEQVYLQAQRAFDLRVGGSLTRAIGGDVHTRVAGEVVHGCRGDRHLRTGGDRREAVQGRLSFDVGESAHLRVREGAVVVDAGHEIHLAARQRVVIDAGQRLCLRVGGSFIDLSASGVHIVGPVVQVNQGGATVPGGPVLPLPVASAREAMHSRGLGPADAPAPVESVARPSPQASSFALAARTGAPFCAVCTCTAS